MTTDISDRQRALCAWAWRKLEVLQQGIKAKKSRPVITFISAMNNGYASTKQYVDEIIAPFLEGKGIRIEYLTL